MTLEEHVAFLNSLGYTLKTLCQCSFQSWTWRASAMRPGRYCDGYGKTWQEAMEALHREIRRPPRPRPVRTKPNLDDLELSI